MYIVKNKLVYLMWQKLLILMTYMEYGNGFEKAGSAILLTAISAPFAALYTFMYHGVFTDSAFLNWIVVCLIVDMIGGMWKHYKLHTFNWKRLYLGLVEKIGVSFLGMILFNSLFSIHEWSGIDSARNYLILIGKLANLMYICGSCFNNLYVITGGKFPPVGWMRRMSNFNDTLNTDKLTEK